jgi:hypothetical protein
MAGDSLYSQTVLSLHCNGANGSTTFTDTSASPKTVTAQNGAAISTAQSKFNGSSLLLDGVNDHLSVPAHSDFNLSVPFTVEAWVYPTALPSSSTWGCVVSNRPADNSGGWRLLLQTNAINFSFVDAAEVVIGVQSAGAVSLNSWQHLAITWDGTTTRIFNQGVLKVASTTLGVKNSSGGLLVGVSNSSLLWPFTGYIADLRITRAARYTASFTPPAQSFPDYLGDLSGNWYKGASDIVTWRAKAVKCLDGSVSAVSTITGSTYKLITNTLSPHEVTIAPAVDYAWSASKVAALGGFVVAANPDATPFQFEVTTAGTFGATQPVWNTTVAGTTTSGTAVLTCRGALIDPITLGPKIPS